jgi:hypothetical protein
MDERSGDGFMLVCGEIAMKIIFNQRQAGGQ